MRKRGVSETPFPEGLLLYDPETGKSFVLNETAAFIWERADSDPEAIARALATEYEVSFEEALEDVREVIGRLREEGFLV